MSVKYEISEPYENALNDIAAVVHQCNVDRGWWEDLYEVLDIIDEKFNDDVQHGTPEHLQMRRKVRTWFILAKVSLIHSEVSEMVEGIRKQTMDSHLPHREADEVEAADTLIRLLDLCGHMGLDIGGAMGEKFTYNQEREDHKPENRNAPGGKTV